MASADLKKHLRGYVLNGIAAHNFRTKENHSNKDIRPELTPFNRHYGPQTAEEFQEKFRAMVAAMDEKHPPKRKKKDRKEGLGVLIFSPREGMSPEDEAKWSQAAYEVMLELFPEQVVGGTYHADEVHKYIDPNDGLEHVSRGHTHIELIPWTDTKGLNMDEFYKRTLPNRINEALDEKCRELFGYAYRDGSQKKSRGSVERMKQKSTEAAIEKAEADLSNKLFEVQEAEEATRKAEKARQEAEKATQKAENEKKTAERDLEALRSKYNALESKLNATEAREEAARQRADSAEQRADRAEERLEKAEGAFARFMQRVSEWVENHHGLERILRVAVRLSEAHRRKIEKKMEKTVEEGGKAILEATESVEGLLAAEDVLEKGKRTFDILKTATKNDLDPDDLEEERER